MDGKRFELDIKKSIPRETYFQRIYDQTYDHTSTITRFTKKNPFDCLIFSKGTLYLLELKSTKQNSISVQTQKGVSKMISMNQIEALSKASSYCGVNAGFLFNFRFDVNYCFYLSISKFNAILEATKKKSINF